ncbi:MAG TPA: NUDIX hydrolase [Pseudomonadota bacterium]|nr:NUDIX hydrolase [Pseudomonadota bacterium]
MNDQHRFSAFVLERQEELGRGHYLRLARVHLRNRYEDGSLSAPYFCEYVDRPSHGTDAVVLALWRRNPRTQSIEVLLRKGLRPALRFGREAARLTVPDEREYGLFCEAVAGILEADEKGEAGIKRRAVQEALEEAGVRLSEQNVVSLGHRCFPSPGMTPEAFHLLAAEVVDEQGMAEIPQGDGSPMEEGAEVFWCSLEDALHLCEDGTIQDAKTELLLFRLAQALGRQGSEGARRSV